MCFEEKPKTEIKQKLNISIIIVPTGYYDKDDHGNVLLSCVKGEGAFAKAYECHVNYDGTFNDEYAIITVDDVVENLREFLEESLIND